MPQGSSCKHRMSHFGAMSSTVCVGCFATFHVAIFQVYSMHGGDSLASALHGGDPLGSTLRGGDSLASALGGGDSLAWPARCGDYLASPNSFMRCSW